MAQKKPSLRKVLRQAQRLMPHKDPRCALWIYQRTNQAIQELQEIIARDLAEDARNAVQSEAIRNGVKQMNEEPEVYCIQCEKGYQVADSSASCDFLFCSKECEEKYTENNKPQEVRP